MDAQLGTLPAQFHPEFLAAVREILPTGYSASSSATDAIFLHRDARGRRGCGRVQKRVHLYAAIFLDGFRVAKIGW
jgi:hypothetical protein